MSQVTDRQQKSEIERIVDLDRLGANGAALDIAASEGERAALAKRFGFLGLPAFAARVTVDRRIGGQVVVEGRLRGRIVQACVLTLDPVMQELDDTFRLVFKKDLADERDPESGEAVLSAQADAPEPLSGNLLDVGEIVAEQLSLAADPYPRRPGAKLEDVLPRPRGGGRKGPPEPRRHPFAGLAALRDKPRRCR
jgi:uncharacterized metal-binding protein YceD (DUF177 family)